MFGPFENRVLRGLLSAGVAVAVLVGSAQAQVGSPTRIAQRAPLTQAQLGAIMATAIPMETLLDRDPTLSGPSGGGTGVGAVPMRAGAPAGVAQGEPQMTEGRRGRIENVGARFMRMYGEGAETQAATSAGVGPLAGSEIAPQAYGEGNANTIYQYNDYLQVPFPVTYAPWRQAGYYLFQASDGLWYHCTAALIHRAIIVTAGHCVHDGSTGENGWNRDGYFFPGYSSRFPQDEQRYGSCQTTFYSTTNGWYNNGVVGNGVDVAMALCGDLEGGVWNFPRGRMPGAVLGWFGMCWENCERPYNFMTQIGYPGNYFGGEQMTISQHLEEMALTGGPDYVYGTGMRGGSSGGPHVTNIGWMNDSSSIRGYSTQRNTIFAVTSWGYTSEALKLQGASPISGYANGNNARGMYNLVCAQSRALHGNWTCSDL